MLVRHNARLAGDLGSGNLHFKQGMQCPIQHVKLPLWCLAQTAAGSQLLGTTWPGHEGTLKAPTDQGRFWKHSEHGKSRLIRNTLHKTRESADSPPCNCRHDFFFILRMKCWKPGVFCISHVWKAFREYHFALRGPIQNEENGISCRRNNYFLTTSGKYGSVCWSKKSPAQTV